jgi:group I intron endonuclease
MSSLQIYGHVYKITNLINRKIYIGQTKRKDPLKRFKEHMSMCGDNKKGFISLLSRAVKKYGHENFSFELLKRCYCKESLDLSEGEFIEIYNSHNNKFGYNVRRFINGKSQYPEYLIKQKMRGRKNSQYKSKYIGVYVRKGFYLASINVDGENKTIGCFLDEMDAAKARDIKELEYSGDMSNLNFPELKNDYITNNIIVTSMTHIKNKHSNVRNVFFNKLWEVHINNNKIKYRKFFHSKEEAENMAISLFIKHDIKKYYKQFNRIVKYNKPQD